MLVTLRMIAEARRVPHATVRYWSYRDDWPARVDDRRPYQYDDAEVGVWFEGHPGLKPRAVRALPTADIGWNGCLNFHPDHPEHCVGPVELHQLPSEWIAWRRCRAHWQAHVVNMELVHLAVQDDDDIDLR